MLCQRCHQKDATVHITQIANGMLRELHLCGECAGRQFLPDMLTGKQLLEQMMQSQRPNDIRCPRCNTSLLDFQQTGYVGCPACYDVFRQQMEPMLLAVHGVTSNNRVMTTNRRPSAGHEPSKNLALGLRDQLQQAIQEERYEEAAKLRDRIKSLESEASQ